MSFDSRMRRKAKALLKARRNSLENIEKNKRKLKSKIIKENKEYMLLLTPEVLGNGNVKFKGKIYIIKKFNDKYVFETNDKNIKKAVLFDGFDEIRELAEEIKCEANLDIEYDLKEYKTLGEGSLRFYYCYTEN